MILVFNFIQTDGIERFRYQPLQLGTGRIFIRTSDTLGHTLSFFIDFFSYYLILTFLKHGRWEGRQQNSLKDKRTAGSNASRDRIHRLRQGASTTELAEGQNDCGFERVQRPDPSPEAGGSTTELT